LYWKKHTEGEYSGEDREEKIDRESDGGRLFIILHHVSSKQYDLSHYTFYP